MAVFVAFVDNKDTINLRKKTKKNRKEVVRRASMIGSANDPEALALSQKLGKSARLMQKHRESLLSSPRTKPSENDPKFNSLNNSTGHSSGLDQKTKSDFDANDRFSINDEPDVTQREKN